MNAARDTTLWSSQGMRNVGAHFTVGLQEGLWYGAASVGGAVTSGTDLATVTNTLFALNDTRTGYSRVRIVDDGVLSAAGGIAVTLPDWSWLTVDGEIRKSATGGQSTMIANSTLR